jgi:S-methylmethionine-dependent homocysteine/selenocysteine methylase
MNFNGGNILKNLELYVSYGKINKTGNYKKIYEKKSDSFVYQFHKLLVSLFANNSITSIKGVDLFNIFFRYP